MTLYEALHLPIKIKDNNYSSLCHSEPLRCPIKGLKRCKLMSVKCQQVNQKRLPSDHDPESD